MSALGTRDSQMIARSGAANMTREDTRFTSRADNIKRTTIGFTGTDTVYDTALSGAFAGYGAGDLVDVRGSPENSRTWRVTSATPGTAVIAATGTITFTLNPSNNATITLNGTVVTFKTTAGASPEVEIGANLAATMTALLAILNASADAELVKFTYAVDATTLFLTAATAGEAGNSLTIAASVATVSAATLAGGAAQVDGAMVVTPAMVTTEAAGAAIQLVRR